MVRRSGRWPRSGWRALPLVPVSIFRIEGLAAADATQLDGGEEDVRPDRYPSDHRRRRTTRCRWHLVAGPHSGGWHLSGRPARPAGGHGTRAGAAVCRCANDRGSGRAGGSRRIGGGPDHRVFPARVSARPGSARRDRGQPPEPPAGWPHPAFPADNPGRQPQRPGDAGRPRAGRTMLSPTRCASATQRR
jgi:hypothetical protein